MMTEEANNPTIMMICFSHFKLRIPIPVFLISTPQKNCKQTRPVNHEMLRWQEKSKRAMMKENDWSRKDRTL